MIALLLPALLSFCLPAFAVPQAAAHPPAAASQDDDRVLHAQQLLQQQKWADLVQSLEPGPQDPPELDLYRGIALARLGRVAEAQASFNAGLLKSPDDKRFLTEMAGVAFQQKDFSRARRCLRRVLRTDPHDAYALDFLATLYFLDDNLEAALECWNRAGKPEIRSVSFEPALETRPALIDRALAFAPLDLLRLDDLETSRARLRNLEIFNRFQFALAPIRGDGYQITLRAAERDGWGDGALGALLSIFRGLPYQTVFPAYSNLGRGAANLDGLLRWDDQKRRLNAGFSMPLRQEPWWRLALFFDARDENWNLSRSLEAASSAFPALNLQRQEAGFEVRHVQSGRWQWHTGASLAHRSYRNLIGVASSALPAFSGGYSLAWRVGTSYQFLRVPARRLRADAGVSTEIGTVFARPLGDFAKTQASLRLHWFPQARGEDYEMAAQLRAGGLFGSPPFDEIYMLGVERDNDLWLRSTVGTENAQKGSAPLGRRYLLWNWNDDKVVYRQAFFTIRLGPFLDIGRITDPSAVFGDSGWRADPGIECKVRVLGSVEAVFFFGRDLRAGRNAYYATTTSALTSAPNPN